MSNTAKRRTSGRRQPPPEKSLDLFRRPPPPVEVGTFPPLPPEGRSSPSDAAAPDGTDELEKILEAEDPGGHKIAKFHAHRAHRR